MKLKIINKQIYLKINKNYKIITFKYRMKTSKYNLRKMKALTYH